MTVGEVLAGVRLQQPLSPELAHLPVGSLEYDSRRVQKGDLAQWMRDVDELRRDQRQFAVALELLARALATAPAEARGRILLKRSSTLEQQGDIEPALSTRVPSWAFPSPSQKRLGTPLRSR